MRSKGSTSITETIRTLLSGARTMSSWTISLVVCIVAAVVLIAAHQPSHPADAAIAKTSSAAQKTPAIRTQAAAPAATKTPATKAEATAPVPESTPMTVTGCLEGDGQRFQLKNTTGADVPKARSWKSGFLKKGSATLDVVDATSLLNLSSHVGQRVTISGAVADREMQARSLRRVASSCD